MQVTVTYLVRNFARACRAIVRSLDAARVPWRDGQQYDDFDRIAEALFEGIVVRPCLFQAVGEEGIQGLTVARYGFAPLPGSDAHIIVRGAPGSPMIGLVTVCKPFDHVRCEAGVLPLRRADFSFVARTEDGTNREWTTVDLNAE